MSGKEVGNKKWIGFALVLASNLIYLANNYAIKWAELKSSEVAMVRGAIQVLLFSLVLLHKKSKKTKAEDEEKLKQDENTTSTLNLIVLLISYGAMMATMSFACLSAIPFMPVGDLIVICFASPAVSVFLERLLLKTPFTIIGIFLSLTIVAGDVLVVQPPFIFGEQEDSINQSTTANHTVNQLDQSFYDLEYSYHQLNQSHTHRQLIKAFKLSEHDSDYYLGVGLCIYSAFAAAMCNILNTKLNRVGIGSNPLMLISGAFSLLVSLISLSFMDNRIVSGGGLELVPSLMLPASAIVTMLAFWFITIAIDLVRQPTLISMLRSTEILFSLFTDSFYNQEFPGPLKITGSAVVLLCVCGMSCQTQLGQLFSKIRNCGKRKNDEDNDDIISRV